MTRVEPPTDQGNVLSSDGVARPTAALRERMDSLRQTPAPAWVRHVSPVLPPRFAIVEMLILATLVMLEYWWEGFPSLTRINPHPYWIAILLLSLQYGTVSGLIAASIAIIGTVLIGMPEPDIEERYFNYLIRVWTQPVLWLLVALLLGAFRARQIEQRDELILQTENMRIRGGTLLDYATNLRTRCTMLERRTAMRETTRTDTLLTALARLRDAEPGRWAAALATVLDAGFPHSRFSLYAVDGATARLVLAHSRSADVAAARVVPLPEIEPNHPLLTTVVMNGRSACVIDPQHDAALRGVGVAAVPIFALAEQASVNRVIGLLKADMLPPNQIDASTTIRMSVVAAHLAPVLQRGLINSVLDTSDPGQLSDGLVGGSRGDRPDGLDEAIPSVRKWRLKNWLPGGRTRPISSDNRDG